jgi:hypothetical protein
MCEIHRDDACPPEGEWLTVMLAAGVPSKPKEDESFPYLAPPLFAISGYTDGFQGLFSNIWQVQKNPSICDEQQL